MMMKFYISCCGQSQNNFVIELEQIRFSPQILFPMSKKMSVNNKFYALKGDKIKGMLKRVQELVSFI